MQFTTFFNEKRFKFIDTLVIRLHGEFDFAAKSKLRK